VTQFVLRPYQQEVVRKALWFLSEQQAKCRNGLLVIPTGAGKSLLIAEIVKALNSPCLVFQPSKEILEQNYRKMVAYGYGPAIYSDSMRRKQVGEITLATIGSVVNKAEMFAGVKYVVVDEAHLVNPKEGMYSDFLNSLGDVRIVGLTATPYRLSRDGYGGSILKFVTRTRPRVFQAVIHYVQNGDLLKQGYWAPLQYKNWNAIDKSKLKLNSTGADYTDKSVKRHFTAIQFHEKLERVVNKLLDMGRRRILVFTRFVEESEYLALKIPGVEIVTAETPKAERDRVVNGFRSGAIPVVSNVGVLGIGFDYPELDTVVLGAPTMSLARYYQQVGRAVRPHPGKDHALVIDMVGLVEQFGKVEDLVIDPCTNGKWEVQSNGRPLTGVYFGDPETQRFWIERALQKKLGGLFAVTTESKLKELIGGLTDLELKALCGLLNDTPLESSKGDKTRISAPRPRRTIWPRTAKTTGIFFS